MCLPSLAAATHHTATIPYCLAARKRRLAVPPETAVSLLLLPLLPLSYTSRYSCSGCLRLTPWSAFVTSALFLGGLACFIAGGIKVWDYTNQVMILPH